MGTVSLHLGHWSLSSWRKLGRKLRHEQWRGLWQRLAPRCRYQDCVHLRGLWGRVPGQRRGVRMQGAWYCLDRCLERALTDEFERMRSNPKAAAPAHRVPLGLLLFSRQQLSAEQLRRALAAQRAAGRGRIGEWLQELGFASEQQITSALARQWRCPVLRANSLPSADAHVPQLPVTLLESFSMVPVGYVSSTRTLHLAFSEGIDYTVLYAIEQMLECHTEPCLVQPSALRKNLAARSQRRGECEVVFDRVADTAELARIVRSYAVRVAASEIRLADCGPHFWVRLPRAQRAPLDLLLRSPGAPAISAGIAVAAPAV